MAAPQFDADRDAVIVRAAENGVSTMIVIGDTLEESKKGIEIAKFNDAIFCTIGLHPHCASDWKEQYIDILIQWSQNKNVVGIGEIGLDYHYDHSPRDVQQEVFKKQLQLSKELNLPAVLHSRNAIEDTWETVHEVQPYSLVLHCCTERFEDVERFIQAGYFLSFTGIATYPKSDVIRETIKRCPLESMLLETDAPYLAPQKHRGKRNEPAYVKEVAICVSKIKGLDLEDVERVTDDNAKRLFGIQ